MFNRSDLYTSAPLKMHLPGRWDRFDLGEVDAIDDLLAISLHFASDALVWSQVGIALKHPKLAVKVFSIAGDQHCWGNHQRSMM